MRYVKKPIPIEAWQLEESLDGAPKWLLEAVKTGEVKPITWNDGSLMGMCILTHEGKVYAHIGDYVVKGVDDELYPCSEEIFEKSYDPVED